MSDRKRTEGKTFPMKHPIIVNALIIIAIAVLGILILYLSIGLFTKHGQKDKVPSVVNMSYTEAVSKLQEEGFKVEISDSLYSDEVAPGHVMEQYPKGGSIVKPGRKIFLYINAVSPKEVIIDDENKPGVPALYQTPERTALARLQELGFKNVKVVYVLGDTDCVMKITANGKTVRKLQKVPVNAKIVVEIADNRLSAVLDSLQGKTYNDDDFYPGNEYLQEAEEYNPYEVPYEENSNESASEEPETSSSYFQ